MPKKRQAKSRISVKASPEYLRLHREEPDYKRDLLKVNKETKSNIKEILCKLYGSAMAKKWYPEIKRRMQVYYAHKTSEMIEDDAGFQPENRFTGKRHDPDHLW